MRLAVVDNDASEAEKLTDGIRKSAEDIETVSYTHLTLPTILLV